VDFPVVENHQAPTPTFCCIWKNFAEFAAIYSPIRHLIRFNTILGADSPVELDFFRLKITKGKLVVLVGPVPGSFLNVLHVKQVWSIQTRVIPLRTPHSIFALIHLKALSSRMKWYLSFCTRSYLNLIPLLCMRLFNILVLILPLGKVFRPQRFYLPNSNDKAHPRVVLVCTDNKVRCVSENVLLGS
jgi:hypothetical protein